ncbi:MAG: TIGR03936 family radical SAM-associated protein [Ruminococcus sp.]
MFGFALQAGAEPNTFPHLDLIRCFQRAVCRAGLPAAYLRPDSIRHMQTSFAATLPLGFTSTAEVMELSLSEPVPPEEVLSRLNAALPPDIRILEAGAPQHTFRELAYATYSRAALRRTGSTGKAV